MSATAAPQDHVELDRADLGADVGRLARMPLRDLAVRFGFGAAVSVVAGAVGLALGERAGGMLLAFPAILPAALTLIEKREGTAEAVADVRGAVVGAAAMVCFAVTVVALAGRIPTAPAILCAGVGWGAAGIGMYFTGTRLAAVLGEQAYLPEVGVVEAQPAVDDLRRRGLRAAVVETDTGGALAALLRSARDGAEALAEGVVLAADERGWTLLGLAPPPPQQCATEATAAALAQAALRLGAEVGLGVAGPAEGGEDSGVTWIVVEAPQGRRTARLVGDRGPEANRGDALRTALRLCHEVLGSR